MRKGLAGLALVILMVSGLVGSSSWWLPSWIQHQAVAWMEKTHHRRLTVDKVVVTLFPLHVRVEGVQWYEADGTTPEVGFAALDGVFSWRSLWHGVPVVESVTLQAPVIHLRRDDNGQWNLAALATPSSGSGGAIPVLVENLKLVQGDIELTDRLSGQQHRIRDLDVTLPLLSTRHADAQRWVDLTVAALVDEAPLHITAQFQPWARHWAAKGTIQVDKVSLERWAPATTGFSAQGEVGFAAAFGVESGNEGMRARLDHPLLNLPRLDVASPAWALHLRQGVLRGDSLVVDPGRGVTLTHGVMTGEHLMLASAAHRAWNLALAGWQVTLAQGAWGLGGAEQGHADLTGLAWQFHAFDLGCDGSAQPCQLSPKGLKLASGQGSLNTMRWPLADQDSELELQTDVDKTGHGALKAVLNVQRGTGHGDLNVDGVPLKLAQPYLKRYARILIDRGTLALKGKLTLGEGQPWHAHYQGSLQADHLTLRDARQAQLLWRSKTFYLGGVDVAAEPLVVNIDQVAVSDFYARVMLMPDGTLNLKRLLMPAKPDARSSGPGDSPVTAAPAPAKARHPPLRVTMGKVVLQGGKVHYKDSFVRPSFETDLSRLGGVIAGLSTREGSEAKVNLRGRVNGAPLQIKGHVNPLAATTHMNLNAQVRDMDLSTFSPYSDKYVGYDIEKGKLSFDVTYRIHDGHLNAENRLMLNQLTFGKRASGEPLTHLPVELAVALLKDGQGNIAVNLPVEGSLNDPQFSVEGILGDMLVNLVKHAVESPFALLDRLIAQHGTVSWMMFDPGSAQLGADQQKKMEEMASSLSQHPGARLDIQGCADRQVDGVALQHQVLLKKVVAARLRRHPDYHGSQNPALWPGADYQRWLTEAYRSESFPKPKNLFGFDRTLSIDEMEQLMLTNAPVTTGQLDKLAEARASMVQNWLVQHQIEASRLYRVHDSKQDKTIDSGVSRARVDFILHP